MSTFDDWNAKTIAEFRANEDRVGGHFAGAPWSWCTTAAARADQLACVGRRWSRSWGPGIWRHHRRP